MIKTKVIRKINETETDEELEGRVNLFLADNLYAHVDAKFKNAVVVVFDPR